MMAIKIFSTALFSICWTKYGSTTTIALANSRPPRQSAESYCLAKAELPGGCPLDAAGARGGPEAGSDRCEFVDRDAV